MALACSSRRHIAWLRASLASSVSAVISPPKKVWQPAQAVPTTLRDRTVMPQQAPITLSTAYPGGGSMVVMMGKLVGMLVPQTFRFA